MIEVVVVNMESHVDSERVLVDPRGRFCSCDACDSSGFHRVVADGVSPLFTLGDSPLLCVVVMAAVVVVVNMIVVLLPLGSETMWGPRGWGPRGALFAIE